MKNVPSKTNHEMWYPFSDINNFSRDVNRVLDTVFPEVWEGERREHQLMMPAIDVFETQDKCIIKADIPGMTKEDIKVKVKDKILTISGEKKQSNETKEAGRIRMERYYGAFQRSIALPEELDCEKASAVCKDGVLELSFPKLPGAKEKELKININ